MAMAALDAVADALEPDALAEVEEPESPVAEADDAALELLAVADADADAEEDEDELSDSPEEALSEPQVTDRQAVWPVRSFGWAWTQSAFHCEHSKDGTVWS